MAPHSFSKRQTIPPALPEKLAQNSKIPLPDYIGPYKVENLLEKGGMSILYLATHPDIQAPITIKVLLPKFLSHPEMSLRFLKEAEIIALADHPNIVKLYGYGQWEGGLYIAMEFIQGRSLRQYLNQNPLSLKTALEMVLEIAYALCHLHTHGVIHRDLKPENILINEKGHVKVIDFGIAQLIDPFKLEKENELPETKQLIGTPIYMSPEQLADPESTSYPSDIYSLGIIAYELILGKFHGGRVYLSLMPKGLEKILSKALQAQVSDRYIDIVDFISDLSSYLHSPQFEKEKKASDHAGELFEKLQMIQHHLITTQPSQNEGCLLGLSIHRPYGYSGIYAEYSPKNRRIMLGESSNYEIDSLLHILYLKGLLDGLSSIEMLPDELAIQLNRALLQAPNNYPFSFAQMQFFPSNRTLRYLSCGYGPLWKIANKEITNISSFNIALGISPDFPFKYQNISYELGDRFILCPLSETGHIFTQVQFKQFLEDDQHLPPQALADTILRKAKSQHPRFFDEHPFVVAIFQF